jgi:hypothetical protein
MILHSKRMHNPLPIWVGMSENAAEVRLDKELGLDYLGGWKIPTRFFLVRSFIQV